MPEITPAIIALREAVKAYEAFPIPKDGEPSYDDATCQAALSLYMTATGQADKMVASREVRAKLAELRATRATAQLHYDIEHAMEHSFGLRTYDRLNELGDEQMRAASRDAHADYRTVLDSLAMHGMSYGTLAELSRIHCRVCQANERAQLGTNK